MDRRLARSRDRRLAARRLRDPLDLAADREVQLGHLLAQLDGHGMRPPVPSRPFRLQPVIVEVFLTQPVDHRALQNVRHRVIGEVASGQHRLETIQPRLHLRAAAARGDQLAVQSGELLLVELALAGLDDAAARLEGLHRQVGRQRLPAQGLELPVQPVGSLAGRACLGGELSGQVGRNDAVGEAGSLRRRRGGDVDLDHVGQPDASRDGHAEQLLDHPLAMQIHRRHAAGARR